MQFKCKLADFKLKAFVKATIEGRRWIFTSKNLDPKLEQTAGFHVVRQDGSVDEQLTEMPGREFEDELLNSGFKIFFPYASPTARGSILGVDGKEFSSGSGEYGYGLSNTATIGYLVLVQDGEINFQTTLCDLSGGICACSQYKVDLIGDDPNFDEDMRDYLEMFLRESETTIEGDPEYDPRKAKPWRYLSDEEREFTDWFVDLMNAVSENERWEYLLLVKNPGRLLGQEVDLEQLAEFDGAKVIGEIQLKDGKGKPTKLPSDLTCEVINIDVALFVARNKEQEPEMQNKA
jgi:hypothetical protein